MGTPFFDSLALEQEFHPEDLSQSDEFRQTKELQRRDRVINGDEEPNSDDIEWLEEFASQTKEVLSRVYRIVSALRADHDPTETPGNDTRPVTDRPAPSSGPSIPQPDLAKRSPSKRSAKKTASKKPETKKTT